MYIFGAILYIAIKKNFPYIHVEVVLGPTVSCFKPIWLLSMDNLKALNRYHDDAESNPDIVPLFVHFNFWWYPNGSGIQIYCIIANFCSDSSMSTKWGGTRLVKGGGDCIGVWLYSDVDSMFPWNNGRHSWNYKHHNPEDCNIHYHCSELYEIPSMLPDVYSAAFASLTMRPDSNRLNIFNTPSIHIHVLQELII